MKKTRQLHEILAVDSDRQHAANAAIEETFVTFTKRANHFMGQTRRVTFLDESREGENTEETKALDDTVMDRLAFTAKRIIPSFDTLMTKEATNQTATADVVVDGQTLVENAPGTYLLAMEKRLAAMVQMYRAIPTLAPGIEWEEDASQGAGVFKSPAQPQMKTEKVLGSIVLYDATPEHPAQVKETSQDKSVARIDTTQYSGMISPARKAQILGRLEKLLAAFKQARQRANTSEIVDRKAGKAIFDYLHAE